jgi:lysophospholipase L1-like esterase
MFSAGNLQTSLQKLMIHAPTRRFQFLGAPKALLSVVLLQAAFCSLGSAALTGYDGFDYGATGGDLTGKNGGSGWSGAYTDTGNSTGYRPTGLTYTGLSTAGGAANTADVTDPIGTTISFRNLGAAITTGQTWISFLGQRNTAATGTFAGFSVYSGSGVTSEFTIASGGTANWRILDTASVDTGVATTQNVTQLVVAQIIWNAAAAETLNLWINPTLGGALGAPNATKVVDMPSGFNSIRIAASSGVGHIYDEIRIGDSFVDVTPPVVVPVVPIPFALAITPNGTKYDFNWPSKSGKTYDLLSSTDLSGSPTTWAIYDPDGSGGNAPLGDMRTTAPNNLLSAVPADEPARFFAMREKDAAPGFAVTVQNFGVSGNNSSEGLNRLPTVLAANPNHLVIYFGLNDALNSGKLIGLTTYRSNLTSMVNQAITAGVRKVFLVGIHPVNADYLASRHPSHPQILRLQDHLAEYNAAVAQVATATGATFIDWRARFLEKSPGTTIAEATANTSACLLICAANSDPDDEDGLHLTIAGNQALGFRVAQALSSVVVSGDKIACLGDSVTFGIKMTGAGTVTGNTYPAVLNATLNP